MTISTFRRAINSGLRIINVQKIDALLYLIKNKNPDKKVPFILVLLYDTNDNNDKRIKKKKNLRNRIPIVIFS